MANEVDRLIITSVCQERQTYGGRTQPGCVDPTRCMNTVGMSGLRQQATDLRLRRVRDRARDRPQPTVPPPTSMIKRAHLPRPARRLSVIVPAAPASMSSCP